MEIRIKDEYIKLGQALKLASLVGSGVEAKFVIEDGSVLVNGEVETRRASLCVPMHDLRYSSIVSSGMSGMPKKVKNYI